MKAILKSYRQAPRKVRLVANLIKGKTVPRAIAELDVLPKRASEPMKKLLLSAVANAKENDGIADINALLVKEVRVDQGVILKRSMPRAHGSAYPIHKHTSHIMLELVAHAETPVKGAKAVKDVVATPEKEKVTKKPAKKVTKKAVAKK
jgi:large subunit ribosomal protein L22